MAEVREFMVQIRVKCAAQCIEVCKMTDAAAPDYKVYMCVICGFIYEEEKGLPEEDIAPGTRWEDIPDTWQCPDCDGLKADFEMIEI